MTTQQRRPDPVGDIELLLRSRYPLILVAVESRTHPLSKTTTEKITALREWARGRTVSAQ